ncbi:MAG: ribonuclease Z [Chloroflexi bacterium]|nr:ribonuclease Z [Chloroflexota bacterium]MBV9135275.1 ribonuclease Z [Chloroflexota bacterium]MBV9898078.1 ribonuclease Z [Chloroflexota bacterium]
MLDLALLGTGAMLPLPNRWVASALVRYRAHLVLFDCGEGTQISVRSLGWGIKAIDLILISHQHADHIAGLPGLLLTLGNSGRTEPVHVVGPPRIHEVVAGLCTVAPYLPFELRVAEWRRGDCLTLDDLRVTCAEGVHHVPCLAYRLELPRSPRFLPERARALGIPVQDWKRLQRGEGVGDVQPNDVMGPPRAGLAVGLVTDTRPGPALVDLVHGVDLLVCEGTFGADEDQGRAVERRHMTFREAAMLARDAHARQLLLTHFSPAMPRPEAFADNARTVFGNTLVGHDHLSLSLRFSDD